MADETTEFPTGAQLGKLRRDFNAAVNAAIDQMNLRYKAVELAAQFPSTDPIKLAREIFAFLTERDDA